MGRHAFSGGVGAERASVAGSTANPLAIGALVLAPIEASFLESTAHGRFPRKPYTTKTWSPIRINKLKVSGMWTKSQPLRSNCRAH